MVIGDPFNLGTHILVATLGTHQSVIRLGTYHLMTHLV